MPNLSAFRKRNRFGLPLYEAARTLGVPQCRRIGLVPVRGRDEYQRQTRRIPFAGMCRAVLSDAPRKNHTWSIRHLAQPIQGFIVNANHSAM